MNLKVLNEFLTCCGSIWLPAESIPLGWSSRRGEGTETGITACTQQAGWEHPDVVTGQSSCSTWLRGLEKSPAWNSISQTLGWASLLTPAQLKASGSVYHLSPFRAHWEGGTNRPGGVSPDIGHAWRNSAAFQGVKPGVSFAFLFSRLEPQAGFSRGPSPKLQKHWAVGKVIP